MRRLAVLLLCLALCACAAGPLKEAAYTRAVVERCATGACVQVTDAASLRELNQALSALNLGRPGEPPDTDPVMAFILYDASGDPTAVLTYAGCVEVDGCAYPCDKNARTRLNALGWSLLYPDG